MAEGKPESNRATKNVQADNNMAATDLLEQAIGDYLQWMTDMGYSESAHQNRRQTLLVFLNFVRSRQITWDRLFSLETLKAFQGRAPSITVQRTVKALAKYLFEHKRIDKPLRQPYRLPQIYEQFLHYYEQGHQVQPDTLASIRRVLFVFYQYLQKSNLDRKSVV